MLKRKKKKAGSSLCKLEMTPMIDVVFLLLIFFMCATTFKVPDYRIDANLPKDIGNGSPNNPEFEDIPEFRITVDPLDRPRGEVRATFRLGRDTYIPMDQLTPVLRREYHALISAAAHQGKKIPAVIAGHREVDFEYVITALNACGEAGIADVQFFAVKRDS